MFQLRKNGCGFGGLGYDDGEVVEIEVGGVRRSHGLAVGNANDFSVCGGLFVVTGRIWS